MRILQKGIKAAKNMVRRQMLKRIERQMLKRIERQLVREIRMAERDLDIHPERSVYYFGELIPDLSLQLAAVRARLRKSPYEQPSALGNVHGRAALMPLPMAVRKPVSSGAITAPALPSMQRGAPRASNASPATKPSRSSSNWDSATLTRAAF